MKNTVNKKTDITEVYRLYSDMLFRIALMHTKSEEDAMDAVQDVFVKYMSLDTGFNSEEYRKAWFIRVTVNRCHDLLRRKKIRTHGTLEDAQHVSYRSYFDEKSYGVLDAVEALPEKLKTVITLHYLEDMSVEEISGILKISSSGVKMRLLRGREALKEILKEG